jgi:hypothetical protein
MYIGSKGGHQTARILQILNRSQLSQKHRVYSKNLIQVSKYQIELLWSD